MCSHKNNLHETFECVGYHHRQGHKHATNSIVYASCLQLPRLPTTKTNTPYTCCSSNETSIMIMDLHFQYWLLLVLFSVVNMTSLTSSFANDKDEDWTMEQRWVFSVTAISFILSVIACTCHLANLNQFSEKPIELVMVCA